MGHSADLIQRILGIVQKDYPVDQFSFSLERAIPGTRMQPDILVRDLDGGLQCAVEIGYTRPEKLTAYRKDLKIPDVRWYDKAGILHADVEERIVRVALEVQPTGFFVAYVVQGWIQCRNTICEQAAEFEEELVVTDAGWTKPLTDEQECEVLDVASEYRSIDTCLIVVTDFSRAWYACFCDKCGDTWMASEDELEVFAVADAIRTNTAREVARDWGARQYQGNWEGVVDFVKGYLGIELRYEDCEYLDPEEKQLLNRQLAAVRLNSRTVQAEVCA